MASVDIQEQEYAGPRQDRLGLGLFIFHIAVSLYILFGWLSYPGTGLYFYVILLPAIAAQWHFNQGCCVINNFETWLRTGRWRDPCNREEGAFLMMICEWWWGVRPHPRILDRLSYGVVGVLWTLAMVHLSWHLAA
jgi:hypothetical protein